MVSLAQRRAELAKMAVPVINADGSCPACLKAMGGGHCEYHKLWYVIAELERGEMLRSLRLPSGDGDHIPHNGCDLNQNEDRNFGRKV